MFSYDVEQLGATTELSVDRAVAVVLVGLQPVYAHGLRAGLTAAGLRCTLDRAADVAEPPYEAADLVVAVVPCGSTTDVRREDLSRFPAVHVLAEASMQAYADALRAGATGAFAHDADTAAIARVVSAAALGLTVLPVGVARALNRRSAVPGPHLTGPELRYLRLLADGATVAGIGRRSGFSEREMFRLLAAVYDRLGARNRTEALLLAQRFGLLDEQP